MKKVLLFTLVFSIVIILASCSQSQTTPSDGVRLTVSAASSLTDAVEKIKTVYEDKNSHVSIVINFGPSGQLQQQIEQGADVDVFMSAAQKQMDALLDKGLISKETQVNILRNELVLIVPKGKQRVSGFKDLLKDDVLHIGIGNPESVPAGQYAKETLQRLELWDKLQYKLVEGQNVRTVLSFVETQNAEAGFVYRSDTAITDQVEVAAVAPGNAVSPIIYPAAVVKSTKYHDEASRFVEFLTSDTAGLIFEEFGFKKPD